MKKSLLDFWSFIFWPFLIYFGPILGQIWITYGPNLGFNTKCMNFHMKNNALLFKWSRKMVLTDSVDQIVCFWLSRPNLVPKCPNMTLSSQFLKFHVKFVLRGWNYLKELISGPFYIHLTILDLFWTNFGSVLDYLWTKFGLQYPINELLHKK